MSCALSFFSLEIGPSSSEDSSTVTHLLTFNSELASEKNPLELDSSEEEVSDSSLESSLDSSADSSSLVLDSSVDVVPLDSSLPVDDSSLDVESSELSSFNAAKALRTSDTLLSLDSLLARTTVCFFWTILLKEIL
eukprot:NODE_182_length_15748_cov_0.173174.p10 type:complete len:136 gc:universal NODE_182_length_15748_cov_0.173174:6169-6576(+)